MTEPKKQRKTKWKPKDNRFVAFFDILGFKDLVMKKSHDEIYDKLNNISKTKKWLEEWINDPAPGLNIGNAEIYTVSFSDSIVLFSKTDDLDNFKVFLVAARWFFANAIIKHIPLKGGIAHGEISINKSEQIYFGQAIIDAYLMEEDVNYLGITAHNSIDAYINHYRDKINQGLLGRILFDTKTPLKCGEIEHKNVDWFSRAIDDIVDVETKELTDEEKKDIIEELMVELRYQVSGSPRRYIDNTLKVLNRFYS